MSPQKDAARTSNVNPRIADQLIQLVERPNATTQPSPLSDQPPQPPAATPQHDEAINRVLHRYPQMDRGYFVIDDHGDLHPEQFRNAIDVIPAPYPDPVATFAKAIYETLGIERLKDVQNGQGWKGEFFAIRSAHAEAQREFEQRLDELRDVDNAVHKANARFDTPTEVGRAKRRRQVHKIVLNDNRQSTRLKNEGRKSNFSVEQYPSLTRTNETPQQLAYRLRVYWWHQSLRLSESLWRSRDKAVANEIYGLVTLDEEQEMATFHFYYQQVRETETEKNFEPTHRQREREVITGKRQWQRVKEEHAIVSDLEILTLDEAIERDVPMPKRVREVVDCVAEIPWIAPFFSIVTGQATERIIARDVKTDQFRQYLSSRKLPPKTVPAAAPKTETLPLLQEVVLALAAQQWDPALAFGLDKRPKYVLTGWNWRDVHDEQQTRLLPDVHSKNPTDKPKSSPAEVLLGILVWIGFIAGIYGFWVLIQSKG